MSAEAEGPKVLSVNWAPFITSETGKVGWIDEENVIFNIGGSSTQLGTDCWPAEKAAQCNQLQSIQVWNVRQNRVTVLIEQVVLWCVSRGRMTYAKNRQLFTQEFGKKVEPTGLEAGNTYSWDDCIPSPPKSWVNKDGLTIIEPRNFAQFYEFKAAHFSATRFGFPRTRLTWRFLDGREEHEFLPDGPWNWSDRLWESYYPAKVGTIAVDRPRSYFIGPAGYDEFLPGMGVVSVVGISPSGCQAAFFGAKSDAVTKKIEVRLYATRVC
jgi:hypothetical protein